MLITPQSSSVTRVLASSTISSKESVLYVVKVLVDLEWTLSSNPGEGLLKPPLLFLEALAVCFDSAVSVDSTVAVDWDVCELTSASVLDSSTSESVLKRVF